MKVKIAFLTLLIFTIFNTENMAQSLDAHEWKNRVILLFAPNFENPILQKQLKIFEDKNVELKERKLIVYQITPDAAKLNGELLDLSSRLAGGKNLSKEILKKYEPVEDGFTFILIGLDGGEKMRKSKPITAGELFGKIDQMPMRRSEMRHK